MNWFRKLRELWESVKRCRDRLDALYRRTREWHVECNCPDCRLCKLWFEEMPWWKRCVAHALWGEP